MAEGVEQISLPGRGLFKKDLLLLATGRRLTSIPASFLAFSFFPMLIPSFLRISIDLIVNRVSRDVIGTDAVASEST